MTRAEVRARLIAELRVTLLPCAVDDGLVTFNPEHVADALVDGVCALITAEHDAVAAELRGQR